MSAPLPTAPPTIAAVIDLLLRYGLDLTDVHTTRFGWNAGALHVWRCHGTPFDRTSIPVTDLATAPIASCCSVDAEDAPMELILKVGRADFQIATSLFTVLPRLHAAPDPVDLTSAIAVLAAESYRGAFNDYIIAEQLGPDRDETVTTALRAALLDDEDANRKVAVARSIVASDLPGFVAACAPTSYFGAYDDQKVVFQVRYQYLSQSSLSAGLRATFAYFVRAGSPVAAFPEMLWWAHKEALLRSALMPVNLRCYPFQAGDAAVELLSQLVLDAQPTWKTYLNPQDFFRLAAMAQSISPTPDTSYKS